MQRCLLLPFDLNKCLLGPRYKLCYSIWPIFSKSSQYCVVKISHFGKKSQINHQKRFLTLARLPLCFWPKDHKKIITGSLLWGHMTCKIWETISKYHCLIYVLWLLNKRPWKSNNWKSFFEKIRYVESRETISKYNCLLDRQEYVNISTLF